LFDFELIFLFSLSANNNLDENLGKNKILFLDLFNASWKVEKIVLSLIPNQTKSN